MMLITVLTTENFFIPFTTDFYRPKTKFAKLMFSQMSVCPWGCLPLVLRVWQTPPGRNPWTDIPLGRRPLSKQPLLPSECWDTPPMDTL